MISIVSSFTIVPDPSVFNGAAGPPCDTWVMILAGPPAVAMTYVKDANGLEPSLYGGGGSPSSKSLLASFMSRGSAAFVSATTEGAAADEDDP
jgi:hypothetical protein